MDGSQKDYRIAYYRFERVIKVAMPIAVLLAAVLVSVSGHTGVNRHAVVLGEVALAVVVTILSGILFGLMFAVKRQFDRQIKAIRTAR